MFYLIVLSTQLFIFLYNNFIDFTFGNNDTTKAAASPTESDMVESDDTVQNDIVESDTTQSHTMESNIFGTAESNIVQSVTTESVTTESVRDPIAETTESVRDPIAEALASVEDFDFEVEVFDWENFENDIDFGGMDFGEYL